MTTKVLHTQSDKDGEIPSPISKNAAEYHGDARQESLTPFREKGTGMLILQRYRNEIINVGDDIRVVIDDIRGNHVRIYIEAPPEISIHREEVYEAIQRGESRRQSAAKSTLTQKEFTRLVLSRKKDESIRIGDDIRITITDIRGDRVRIGIEAPRSVSVHRQEVYEKIKNENNPVAKAVASANSVTNVRSIATRTIVARKGVMPMP